MRIVPTSKQDWLILLKLAVAFGAGLAMCLFCHNLINRAWAQTGEIVPVDIQVSRDVVFWMWLPLSLLPWPHHQLGDTWDHLHRWFFGVVYGIVVALIISWLLKKSGSKKM